MLPEEVLRHRHADTCAIPGLAVGVDSAPVPDILQRHDAHLDNLAARLSVQRSHKAHAAGIVLIGRIIGMTIDQLLAVGFVLLYII